MKKVAIIAITLLMISAWVFVAKTSIQAQIIKHLENGEVVELATYFTEGLTVFLPNGIVLDNAEHAERELISFFEADPPKQFILKHQGNSKGKSSSYFIGMLQTESKIFRLTVVISKDKIESLSFDPEEIVGFSFYN